MRKLFSIAMLLLLAAGAQADVVRSAQVEAELIAQRRAIVPGEPIVVGARMKMDPNWHVYWRNPGDSGLVTKIKWQLPDGFIAGDIQWPGPHRFELGGLINFGYEGEIVLPVTIQTPPTLEPGTIVTLNADASWLACEMACIPGKASLSLRLPVSDGDAPIDTRWADLFAAAKVHRPRDIDPQRVNATRDGDDFQFTLTDAGDAQEVYFYPLDADTFNHVDPQPITRSGDDLTIRLTRNEYRTEPIERLSGVLELDGTYFRIDTPLTSPAAAPAMSTATLLLYALLGGMLLNLMPCVFPVLSIKILGFVNQAGEDKGKILRHGLVFAGGVLASFWLLTAVLLALRAGGEQLGWGFQLQQPGFVAALAVLMFLVGLNLAGVFEIGIGLMNVAGRAQSQVQGGYGGSFFSGVLAVIIATPCTAPFMGPAIGAGLALPAAQTAAVFTALGVGMALPYVLLSAFPGWLNALPKPGPWMVTFKQLMSFGMFGAAIWLVWVFGQQAGGVDSVLMLLIGLLVAAIAAWMLGRWHTTASRIVAAVLLLMSIALPLWSIDRSSLDWESYSEQRIAQLRAGGQPVFVDFTADWCLTCKWNEKTVLSRQSVIDAFAAHDVALVKADWTLYDADITAALERFGRAGVPLYVVYPPEDAEPIVLPTLITTDMVIDAVRQASGDTQAIVRRASP
jgi:thiol:disulfide interchange protein DsbD